MESQVALRELELPCTMSSTRMLPAQQRTSELKVPRVRDMDYGTFFENYIHANRPCVIPDASRDWPCSDLWVRSDRIHTEYLNETYGELLAPVADCDTLQYDAQCKEEKTVHDYMLYLNSTDNTEENQNLYLKDWHLQRERPEDKFYCVPRYFASDWLNEFALDRNDDDFMFVYIGPQGSWTPLHADVYSSFSWSVNIVGRKRWLLLPPGEEEKLRDSLGRLPARVTPAPALRTIELLQEAGDAIFLPSGWYHQVTNELHTISINHNWINGCNIHAVWTALNNSLQQVEKEIEELKESDDYREKCQIILKALFGMNYASFSEFVIHIAQQRLAQINGSPKVLFRVYTLGPQHVRFDLKAVLNVIEEMFQDETFFEKLEQPHIEERLRIVKSEIIMVIKEN